MNICVVGNGMIVGRFLEDTADVPDIDITAICVRPQSKEKGEALAERFGIPVVLTDYEEALKMPGTDAVYIGISNHMHYSYAKAALLAGHNVICEKPFTVHAYEARELADLAKERGLFLWEAIKTLYASTTDALMENLPRIGSIRVVFCNYSKRSSRYGEYLKSNIHPAFDPEKAGGALYDLNVYNLHLMAHLFGRPKHVKYYANYGPNGVDLSGTVVMEYDGFHTLCTASKDSGSPGGVIFQGEGGYLRLTGSASSGREVYISENAGPEELIIGLDPDEARTLTEEAVEFARQFSEHDLDKCYRTLEQTLMVMDIIDACLDS